MGKSKANRTSAFSLEGRLLNFVFDQHSEPKYLNLLTANGEHQIKLRKHLRPVLPQHLTLGEWVRVEGQQKLSLKGAVPTLKLKADQVTAATPKAPEPIAMPLDAPDQPQTKSGKLKMNVLVCQKSDCRKRGGQAICAALQAALDDRGLQNQVKVKPTGCMKRCKAGPNLIFMPDKARYTKVKPKAIPTLIDKHFV
ncbi:MAG: (2Fe-2S) ferredoxin domain-containing protein [Cyanothece sp. SIO1E1]|nr:(2Fe-2S) ferredoxin domain-containing protein [Cyanothece sp. SIO1E1]